MENKKEILLSLIFMSVFFIIVSVVFGAVLYGLGAKSTSIGLFILFILSFFAIGSFIDLFLEMMIKALTNLLGFSSKQGFSLYLLCDMVVSYQLLKFVGGLYTGVSVPKITAIVFVMIMSILTCLVERPLNQWSMKDTE